MTGVVIDALRLRALRKARGWDQKTLARRAGISPSVVSRLERGLQRDLDASVLVALAQSLDAPVDSLLAPGDLRASGELAAELAAVVWELARLSDAHQRQVAGMLRAYLSLLPERQQQRSPQESVPAADEAGAEQPPES